MADMKFLVSDELLNLIEEGNATAILSADYTSSLNELIKHELISIDKDKLTLTEKGKKARTLGIEAFLLQEKPADNQIKVSIDSGKIGIERSDSSLLIILFFLLISLLAIFTMMGREIS